MKGGTFIGWVILVAVLGMAVPARADTHAPCPSDWNNWSDPNLMVTVGNPGNLGEWSGQSYGGIGEDRICGAVAYEYKIGRYEVTARQYTEFLNKVAATDTYGLYNTNMDYDVYPSYCGCNIKRMGSSGSFSYSVDPNWANRPVNLVSWGDAARFCNWLTNGQPTGPQDANTTEDGSYYLDGATTDAQLLAVTRKTVVEGGRYYIPTEDEWYKAAYHKNDGVTGNYWDYPTSTNSVPSNDLLTPDGGNNATFYQDGYTIGSPYWRTAVGEFELSDSPYGTFDQGGNVWEWNEAVLYGSYRGSRGGSFNDYGSDLLASYRTYYIYCGFEPTYEGCDVGFRVSEVPEPASLAALALGGLALIRRRRR